MLHRVAQRRGGIDGGEDLAARRLDVRFEALDVPLDLARSAASSARSAPAASAALRRGAHGGIAARLELQPGGLAPGLERLDLGCDGAGGGGQRFDLLLVEGDLLLQAAVLELAGVRRLARGGGLAVGLGQFEAETLERRLDLGNVRGGSRLAGPRIREAPRGLLSIASASSR